MAKDIDGGWAWVVVVASVLSLCNTSLLTYNVGLLNISLLEKYEGNVATTSLIGSVYLTLFSMMAPLASLLINTYSCRVVHIIGGILLFVGFSASYFVNRLEILIFTYSILAGAGVCFCYVVVLIVISFNFKKYVGIAIGCSMFGAGCGMLLSGPLTQYFLDKYNLQGSFLLMGGLGLNQVVFGLLMRPTHIEKEHQEERKKNRQNRRFQCSDTCQLNIFKNKSFPLILICAFIWNTPHAIMIFHLPYLAVLQGATQESAAFLITVFGTGSTVGRFLTGVVIGPQGIDPLLLFLGFNGVLGVLSLTFILFATSQIGILIFGFVFGIYSGGVNTIRAPLLSNIVGLQHMSTGIGLFCLMECPGFLVGPPLAGYIVDMTGSYEYSLYLSGGMFLVACLLGLLSSIWRKQEEPEKSLNIETLIPENKSEEMAETKLSSSTSEIIPEERQILTDDTS